MYYIVVRSRPNKKTSLKTKFNDIAGAYIDCWINFKESEGAICLAKFYIRENGWIPEVVTENYIIDKSKCNKKQLGFYKETLKYGYSLIFKMWSKNAPDSDIDYEK